jgi:TRAP-type C4-dicarboxylate transport system substrate-binding protein
MRKVLDGPIGDEILKATEIHGLIGLAFYDSGARSFYNTKRPIHTPLDMKDMKIRVQQSDLFMGLVRAMGAEPVPLPYGDVYAALKAGTIDGAENNWPSYESSKHYETAKNYSLTEHSMVPEILLFSKKIWDTMSKEDQEIFRKAAKESVFVMRQLWDEREQKARQIVEANGVKVVDFVQKSRFVDAVKPFYDKFVTDPNIKDMVKRIRAVPNP